MIGMAYGGPLGALIGGARLRHRALREVGGRRVSGEQSEAAHPANLRHLHRQQHGEAGRRDRVAELRRQRGHGRAQRSGPATREVVCRGDGPKERQLTALTPHAASLIQANGKLQQGAVYENGQAYTYASGCRLTAACNRRRCQQPARTPGTSISRSTRNRQSLRELNLPQYVEPS